VGTVGAESANFKKKDGVEEKITKDVQGTGNMILLNRRKKKCVFFPG